MGRLHTFFKALFSGMIPEKIETDIKSVSSSNRKNSVETDLSLAKLHVCIALLCLGQQYKIIKN
jgi:hypothetical protein